MPVYCRPGPENVYFLYCYGFRSIQERNLYSILTEMELIFKRCLKSNKKFYDHIKYLYVLLLVIQFYITKTSSELFPEKVTTWPRRDDDQTMYLKKKNKLNQEPQWLLIKFYTTLQIIKHI